MLDKYKFPGGNDVKIVRREDILETIECNIVDKEIALELVRQCEMDAAEFLRKGRWVGIPFLGKIGVSEVRKMEQTPEQNALIAQTYHTATTKQFVLFRKALAHDNQRKLKAAKNFNYILSIAVRENPYKFKMLVRQKGELYARIAFYLSKNIVAINNTYEYLNYD